MLQAARATDRVDVVAVASRDRMRAEEYAREHGLERWHGSYESLLADTAVEAVYISLPNSLHVEWSARALRAGKHVLCEKSLDPRAAEVERLHDLAAERSLILMEAFMYRHHPRTRLLEDLVRGGSIGTLRAVRATFSAMLDAPGDIRFVPELGGGALLDVGCYCVHGTRLLAGEPERVFAEQVVGPTGVDLRFVGTMRFPGDVLAQFDCGLDLPGRSGLEAVGSGGSIYVPEPWGSGDPVVEVRRPGGVERITAETADAYQRELENMRDAIEGKAPPLLGRDDALGQARTLQALLQSAQLGRPVSVPAT
ncbi:MAG: Gfo/Idh/MocA family oxidoreductase [Actinobacteria bacterium]|nr:Gfo/Idh/MocA family oxidoreductase [Actinomycetota bacterium]